MCTHRIIDGYDYNSSITTVCMAINCPPSRKSVQEYNNHQHHAACSACRTCISPYIAVRKLRLPPAARTGIYSCGPCCKSSCYNKINITSAVPKHCGSHYLHCSGVRHRQQHRRMADAKIATSCRRFPSQASQVLKGLVNPFFHCYKNDATVGRRFYSGMGRSCPLFGGFPFFGRRFSSGDGALMSPV